MSLNLVQNSYNKRCVKMIKSCRNAAGQQYVSGFRSITNTTFPATYRVLTYR